VQPLNRFDITFAPQAVWTFASTTNERDPSKVTDAARACLVSLRLISDSHPTEHTIAAYQVIDGGDDVEECHYKNNLPDICVD